MDCLPLLHSILLLEFYLPKMAAINICWVAQKVLSGFPIASYGKTRTNFLANAICPQSEFQLPLGSLGGSPRSEIMCDKALFKLLLLVWTLECVRFCVHPLIMESLFPLALWLSQEQALLAFKARRSGGSSSQCRIHSLGTQMWSVNLLFLGENLCNCYYPLVCGLPSWGCRS